MLDFEYLNVFIGKLKFKKMPKFETLSALRGLSNYIQDHGPAFKLMDLHAFWNIQYAFWNILHAFWNILNSVRR